MAQLHSRPSESLVLQLSLMVVGITHTITMVDTSHKLSFTDFVCMIACPSLLPVYTGVCDVNSDGSEREVERESPGMGSL